MAEYIDREAVIKCIDYASDGYKYLETKVDFAKRDINAIPAADVRPVVRGRWNSDGSCSNCGCYMPTDDAHDAIFKDEVHYCYYCGAKMEE